MNKIAKRLDVFILSSRAACDICTFCYSRKAQFPTVQTIYHKEGISKIHYHHTPFVFHLCLWLLHGNIGLQSCMIFHFKQPQFRILFWLVQKRHGKMNAEARGQCRVWGSESIRNMGTREVHSYVSIHQEEMSAFNYSTDLCIHLGFMQFLLNIWH